MVLCARVCIWVCMWLWKVVCGVFVVFTCVVCTTRSVFGVFVGCCVCFVFCGCFVMFICGLFEGVSSLICFSMCLFLVLVCLSCDLLFNVCNFFADVLSSRLGCLVDLLSASIKDRSVYFMYSVSVFVKTFCDKSSSHLFFSSFVRCCSLCCVSCMQCSW